MNAGTRFSRRNLQSKTWFQRRGWAQRTPDEAPPLRAELFSAEQMAQHGAALARVHRLAPGRPHDPLLGRLDDNENALMQVSALLTAAVADQHRIPPAGEWLLDNFHLIEEQIRTARRHLPKGYSRALPHLAAGPTAGAPGRSRVYDIVLQAVAHGDGRVDTDTLVGYIDAYQRVTPLQLGELWAIPIMLRLAVIENLRRVGVRVANGWKARRLAGSWADQMIATAAQDPKSLILVIADMAHSAPPMVSAFVAELARRVQGRGPALALPLTWIEQHLSETGTTIEQMVHLENQQQAADQVSISNSIGSLRVLGATDWRAFVEATSVVERVLCGDPGGAYAGMEFATRDHYRHAVEEIARRGRLAEDEVARKAVELARAAADTGGAQAERTAHVGYYLIDRGLPLLERAAGASPTGIAALRRIAGRWPLFLYLGAIVLLTALVGGGLLAQARSAGLADWALLPLAGLALLAASRLAVALVNWFATLMVQPHPLPRMDFSTGIPPRSRTLVVVPTLLASAGQVDDLLEALEVRFLANQDANLYFGLLTDFLDAQQASLPGDAALVQRARGRIEALNRKYGGVGRDGDDVFFLFHRARRWNPQEDAWMGYERKRGKLEALNALLRGRPAGEDFSLVVGNTAALSGIGYVITLDTDTRLPRDVARQLVGAMAHPLNRPRYDAVHGRVTEGYGILQPRVAASLPGSNRSRYARLYGGEPGIDPYTNVVSDVYQDLFGEGSYIGKGIYDVEAFAQALGGRLPENRILSHDLLEGCYARAGLLSDVQVYEDYPARYDAEVSRRHRWIRGDWQLAGWLLWRVSRGKADEGARNAHRRTNPLSTLSRGKLIDNLRRSLIPATLLLLLLLGWTVLSPAWLWTLAVIGIMLLPAASAIVLELIRKPKEVLPRQHLTAVAASAARHGARFAMELACLPHEAFYNLDAIVRTGWRMLVSHRRLLEWNPSSEVERAASRAGSGGFAACLRRMWVGPALAATVAILLASAAPAPLATWAAMAPVLLLWFASPLIAWWISRPLVRRPAALSTGQLRFLRGLARRTWAFFDTFVGPEDHWLPPDNHQAYRATALAHRTSPTNIGLALLAQLSARDFGYLSTGALLERTANTFHTLDTLERYRGHFYNWYDTQTLKILPPHYISTVDSGNLAAHLLTLRAGLLAMVNERIAAATLFDGLRDTLAVLDDATVTAEPAPSAELTAVQTALAGAPLIFPATLTAVRTALARVATAADGLSPRDASLLDTDEYAGDDGGDEAGMWTQALARQIREAQDELDFLVPWLALPAPPPGLEEYPSELAGRAGIPTLRALATWDAESRPAIESRLAAETTSAGQAWLTELLRQVAAGSARARERMAEIDRLAGQSLALARMEYGFLYDKARRLLSIGYNVTEHQADPGHYDLLASEARLASFIAIAQGELPQEHWFALGRLLTGSGGKPLLLSWSGSMFEYLMPLLVMPTYDNTLLDRTCKAAVGRQIDYGRQRGVPWGLSESAYNAVDAQLNYQYRAFGVPGLGLKRGLAEDLVVAPYASVLALMVAPEAACVNLQRLAAEGFAGRFGFFEAIDYTPARQRRGQTRTVVRAFMAHHQGMSLLALAYLLLDRPMQRRFGRDRLFQAVMPLLQERIPRATALFPHVAQLSGVRSAADTAQTPIRLFHGAGTQAPAVQLLSNGRYHVMVTQAGGGYSRWKDLAVTRWQEDATRDHWGSFCYVRDLASGTFWSTAHQPAPAQPAGYEVAFSEGRVEFRRHDLVDGHDAIETHTEIVVSPEDDIEVRRVRITNRSRRRRRIDITSYAEVVIAPADADALHPAFSKLFVSSELLPERRAILCTRRPRSHGESAPWMLHMMAVHGAVVDEMSYETDRVRFVGRARSVAEPLAMTTPEALSGSAGAVLDPIVAIRCALALDPEQSVTIDIVSGVAETRDAAVWLVEKYHDRHLADRVFELTGIHSQVALQQLNVSEADAQLYARLAGAVLYAGSALRADPAVLLGNRRGQSSLWGYAISGDLPIVLLQIGDIANLDLVRQLVQAHAYWRLKGLAVDLVIWNEDHAGYRQQLQEQIMGLIAAGAGASLINRPGGIFARLAAHVPTEDRILFQSVARAVIIDTRGTLEQQLDHAGPLEARLPPFVPTTSPRPVGGTAAALIPVAATVAPAPGAPLLFNGLGGFSTDGREYHIALEPGQATPAPWVNVLANPSFGTLVSESGSAYTWSENAHAFRLTPWQDDPVGDTGGEAIYLRDEENGRVWSPTPLPARAAVPYTCRHGFGYSVFETCVDGIQSELRIYVAIDAAVKFSVLTVRNVSGRPRRLSATAYVEWVLGNLRSRSALHVVTEIDPRSGALYARNPYIAEFADHVAFFDVDAPLRTVSGDRGEFIGRNGSLRAPAALGRARLSGKVGAALDPCGTIQAGFDLADGEEHELVFRLGVGVDAEEAGRLVQRFRGAAAARDALAAVQGYWQRSLGAVQVRTPDPAVNLLANGWLVYQTLACRMWARTGYYQSGGAFGFRDQLQDAMALVHAEPALVRAHLLRCAGRQFLEGDVQHWWHPPAGRGVRTRCSDDYLWLPLAVCRYVGVSGDATVLEEAVPFLEGRAMNPEEDSYYDLPIRSAETASLYQHCVRAIRHGLRFGTHGLPLMGSGDWNDGMNLVGIQGKGESVWLGFFLCEVLGRFSGLADAHGDPAFATQCREEAGTLRAHLERHGWDGGWYHRAYFDDGTPLGSAANTECRIDSISQSWSVLGGTDPDCGRRRSRIAMNAVYDRLVRRDGALVQLLDPPFDAGGLEPGYIRGYLPGVRENGGQYTHAAIWAAMAFAELGENERAWELLTLINPINHALTPAGVDTYKVEPYVVAADVYALAPHVGRGGWSWYTGAAGWMYRLIVESLLGLQRDGTTLRIAPRLPAEWPGFDIDYRYQDTLYRIAVIQVRDGHAQASGATSVRVDGVERHDHTIPLLDDRREHEVVVNLVTRNGGSLLGCRCPQPENTALGREAKIRATDHSRP